MGAMSGAGVLGDGSEWEWDCMGQGMLVQISYAEAIVLV